MFAGQLFALRYFQFEHRPACLLQSYRSVNSVVTPFSTYDLPLQFDESCMKTVIVSRQSDRNRPDTER